VFDVSPDHAIGLYAALFALPFALLAVKLHPRRAAVPGTALGASVLMVMAGATHLGLVWTHLQEPVTAALFIANGLGYLVLSQAFAWKWWRIASAALISSTLLGYAGYIALGLDTPDQVAVATKLMELTALGLVLIPVRGQVVVHRTARWAALGVAVPVLTLVTIATVWIDDLARPDALHAHAGAVLQATNSVATPEQAAAAQRLYDTTAAAIAPYRDWHNAWAAGYRPGGPANLPSSHWINQRYVDAGYVLDPSRPQGLVYANTRRGPVLLGAMFEMKHIGQFGPDPGGPLTAWHEHQNICVTPLGGFEFSLMSPTATCPIGAIDITVPAMLHVWIVQNPQGPFAIDIDSKVVKAIDQA